MTENRSPYREIMFSAIKWLLLGIAFESFINIYAVQNGYSIIPWKNGLVWGGLIGLGKGLLTVDFRNKVK